MDFSRGELAYRLREKDDRGLETAFREADRRFVETKRRFDAGSISGEEFDARRRRLMVRDDEGRWWAKSRKSGEWNYHDGSAWVRGIPPGHQPPPAAPAESAPDRGSRIEQGERLASLRATVPGSALI
jgi:hypothetical protein